MGQRELGIGASCQHADGYEESCTSGDGDCKTITLTLDEEQQENVLVVVIILGSCLLLGIALCLCVRSRRTSLSGPTAQGQKNTQGFYSQTVAPQANMPNSQQQQITSSQSMPMETPIHPDV